MNEQLQLLVQLQDIDNMIKEFTEGGERREEELGFRSAFNFVTHKYRVDAGLIKDLWRRGFEIGVHGYSHDGRLFTSFKLFRERIKKVKEKAYVWGACGFRSPATHRNWEWMKEMDFLYDSSYSNVAHFEPQKGGVCTVFPYFIGRMVELPITLPQDIVVFGLFGMKDCKLWMEVSKQILRYRGMILIVTHPDAKKGYTGYKDYVSIYRDFLLWLKEQTNLWYALPREVALWWNKRRLSCVDKNKIKGPARGVGCVERVIVKGHGVRWVKQ